MDIVRNVQIVCSMPGSSVTDEEDFIVWVFFRQFFQENFHTGSITVRLLFYAIIIRHFEKDANPIIPLVFSR